MLVTELMRLASFAIQQGLLALMQGKDRVEVEDLGEEHRPELAALIAYRDSLGDKA